MSAQGFCARALDPVISVAHRQGSEEIEIDPNKRSFHDMIIDAFFDGLIDTVAKGASVLKPKVSGSIKAPG